MLCTKCKIDKPSTEYATYWHSTQQATRVRKVCSSCFYQQKKEYRLRKRMEVNPEMLFINNPDYKKCTRCESWKHIDGFSTYTKVTNYARCKECRTEIEKEEAREKIIKNGGSLRVKVFPNEYTDEYQRKNTFELMRELGYLYNEENGIWYKEPWKTKDGEFPLLPKTDKRIYKYQSKISNKVREQVLDLRSNNISIRKIASKLNISETSVWKICQNTLNSEI